MGLDATPSGMHQVGGAAVTPEEILASAERDGVSADRLLSIARCALQLDVSRDFIEREIKSGELKVVRRYRPSGRSTVRVPEPAFISYIRKSWVSK